MHVFVGVQLPILCSQIMQSTIDLEAFSVGDPSLLLLTFHRDRRSFHISSSQEPPLQDLPSQASAQHSKSAAALLLEDTQDSADLDGDQCSTPKALVDTHCCPMCATPLYIASCLYHCSPAPSLGVGTQRHVSHPLKTCHLSRRLHAPHMSFHKGKRQCPCMLSRTESGRRVVRVRKVSQRVGQVSAAERESARNARLDALENDDAGGGQEGVTGDSDEEFVLPDSDDGVGALGHAGLALCCPHGSTCCCLVRLERASCRATGFSLPKVHQTAVVIPKNEENNHCARCSSLCWDRPGTWTRLQCALTQAGMCVCAESILDGRHAEHLLTMEVR